MKFSVIIPTYNRKNELKECIDYIISQSFLLEEIIIIDDGDLDLEFLMVIEKKVTQLGVDFKYYKKNHSKEPQGLAESKNIAIEIVRNEIFFILDDDVVLDPDFLGRIIEVYKTKDSPNLIGVGGIIKNSRKMGKLERIYNSIFGLTSKYKWDINEVGYQVWDENIQKEEKGYYVHGGLSSYKKSLAKELKFITFKGGRTALEDIDFCLRAKNKGYYFYIQPKAKAFHKQSKKSREKDFLIGFKEGYNRRIIFKNNCKKSFENYLWFWWSSIGWVLRQFLAGHFMKGFGMIKGYFKKLPI